MTISALHPAELDPDHRGDDDRREGGTGEGDEVEDGDDDRQRDRVARADREEDDRRADARDQADEEVSADVAANRAVDVARDPVPPRLHRLRERALEPLDDLRALEEHEDRQEGNRDDTDDEGDDAPGDRKPGVGDAEHTAGALVIDRLLDLVDDLVVVLEEAERAAALW